MPSSSRAAKTAACPTVTGCSPAARTLAGNAPKVLIAMEFAAGDFGFVPKNLAHAYRIERHHSRVVGVAAGPGGTFERFIENLGVPTAELGPPPEPYVPGPRKFATVPPERYDVRFLSGHQWRTGS
ncbi:hypothetical protein ACFYYS_11575 [Streptomyces sp. NPDC002120]|uniref:hypothetical protein n=1 Tax=Streptomyces sp. NPDC002120 TaxID=3364631 RepID=UPI00369CE5E0